MEITWSDSYSWKEAITEYNEERRDDLCKEGEEEPPSCSGDHSLRSSYSGVNVIIGVTNMYTKARELSVLCHVVNVGGLIDHEKEINSGRDNPRGDLGNILH